MKSTRRENKRDETLQSLFGKTSPESSAQKTTHSDALSADSPAREKPSHLPLASGHAQVWSWEHDGEYRGASSMHSTSESPSVGAESSSLPAIVNLSEVLEPSAHPKYLLSARACAGILRRAQRRGKVLPDQLRIALAHGGVEASAPPP